MDEYKKYPIHGVLLIRNFREMSEINSRFGKTIPAIAGMDGCKLLVKIVHPRTRDAFIQPQFDLEDASVEFRNIVVQYFFRLVNKKPENSVMYDEMSLDPYNASFSGNNVKLIDILEENSGWLTHGALKMEYGVYVERVKLRKDEFWKLNFLDPIFDCDENQKMITLKSGSGKLLYTHKQLLTFHSKKYYTVPPDWNITDRLEFRKEEMEICLQLAHGVRMNLDGNRTILNYEPVNFPDFQLKVMILIARSLKLYNVVHYCQYQLMTFEESIENLRFAFKINTRHYSIHLMRKLASREELKDILKRTDIFLI